MSSLILVRHGQAHAFERDSDRLTSLGEAQARKLASHWIRGRVVFDEVYHGTLTRQQQTAEIVGRAYHDAHQPWPGFEVLAGLNEYDAGGILKQLAPQLAAKDPAFRALDQQWRASSGLANDNRAFQRMFEVLMKQWLQGALRADEVEPWAGFRDRVRQAIRGITERGGSGRRIAVFSSGGPIGVMVQTALAAPDPAALEVNWRVRNTSLTEFIFSKQRVSLERFNDLGHLEDPALWTFR